MTQGTATHTLMIFTGALMAGLVEIAQHVCLQLDVYMDHAEIHHSHVNVKMDGKEPCVTCLFASKYLSSIC